MNSIQHIAITRRIKLYKYAFTIFTEKTKENMMHFELLSAFSDMQLDSTELDHFREGQPADEISRGLLRVHSLHVRLQFTRHGKFPVWANMALEPFLQVDMSVVEHE